MSRVKMSFKIWRNFSSLESRLVCSSFRSGRSGLCGHTYTVIPNEFCCRGYCNCNSSNKEGETRSSDSDVLKLLENIKKQKSLQNIAKEEEERLSLDIKQRTAPLTIDELVQFLRKHNLQDICVIRIPPSRNYAHYFVTCTGTGSRHITRMADLLAAEMKNVKILNGQKVVVEGKGSDSEWLVVDIGISVVHFMTEEARSRYDLETLWALGCEFDDEIEEMIRLNRRQGVYSSKVVK
ncbi:PREDICTED: mitochondrial assembly of ribosomal large subunit protein 1-like [Amphimedon queenslandica]|uniref:Mitochondrial assembly of ribosomal large subunit protein 1 n=1 Tax=Amphimedon queenslandica TaxID=400682 RepID=A0A1X7V8Q5_AMPQE|nr:PREDICTED: mitochondrial assembly of ribosomal large subunit protein 1-like [Amphimedon queenslandica]|eukprot:XP_019850111.1 PREDICTED: mitochondrial assembly of ribosomal large subunit protein 1-like [Amphimedon queenslandica]